jgi:hypothetical protein
LACERIATELARQLAPEAGRDRVSVRPGTGSVVVERTRGELDVDAVVRRLRELVASEHADDGRPLSEARPVAMGTTKLAKAVVSAMKTLNNDLRVELEGEADLATLAPIFLAFASAAEISIIGEIPAPSWSSLLWYSLRIFATFNPEVERVEVTDRAT